MKLLLPSSALLLAITWMLLFTFPSFGQGKEFGAFVYVGTNKFVRVKSPMAKSAATRTIPAGTIVRTQGTVTVSTPNGATRTDRTVDRTYTLASDSAVYPRSNPIQPDAFYTNRPFTRANAVQSKDTVYLNYQLFPVPKGKKQVSKEPLDLSVPPVETAVVLGKTAPTTGASADAKFNRENTYYIKLHDRQAVSFWSYATELSALTVPFQYRPGYKKDGKQAYGQLNVDANIGAYVGFKLGRVAYRYRKYETLAPSKFTLSIGPFVSLSRVELDKSNTRLATDTVNLKRSIGSVSVGGAIAIDVYDFRVGLFYGQDVAVGSRQWDFDRRGWWGIGLGYKLAILSKKE